MVDSLETVRAQEKKLRELWESVSYAGGKRPDLVEDDEGWPEDEVEEEDDVEVEDDALPSRAGG